jgi:WS/DGAT/MGAT family acyltransferase
MWRVEGLAGGRVASVCKIHHTLADGVASAELLNEFLTHDPDEELPHDAPPFRPEPLPSWRERLRLGLRDLAAFLPHTARDLARNVRTVRARRREARARGEPALPAATAPRTPFARVLSAQRRFAFTALPLAEANAARRALGVTLNELALALVASTLRAYLLRRGELPTARLVATVPVSRRTEADKGRYGNHTGAMYVPLATEVADPAERLRATQASARAVKQEFQDTKGAQLSDWIELFPPFVSRAIFSRLPNWMMRAGRPPQANVIVSNVPGAREVLYYGETPVSEFYSIGPLLEGVGLNITFWSYGDALEVSVLADRDALRDPWELVADLRAAFEELSKLAAAVPPTS